ncbi:hypothetical protein PCE1_003582 [Barthelona sp. PCE]
MTTVLKSEEHEEDMTDIINILPAELGAIFRNVLNDKTDFETLFERYQASTPTMAATNLPVDVAFLDNPVDENCNDETNLNTLMERHIAEKLDFASELFNANRRDDMNGLFTVIEPKQPVSDVFVSGKPLNPPVIRKPVPITMDIEPLQSPLFATY